MKLLIDMNLSPAWCEWFRKLGWEATHWSEVGDPRAADVELMRWAREHQCMVLTHDLDFSALLATTHADGPSVIQVRTQDVLAERALELVVDVVEKHRDELEAGAIIVVEPARMRIRLLPLNE